MSEEQSAVYRNILMTPLIASILNFAGPDMIVILLIVLLLFGAKKLPELARGMGRAVKEFGAARDEIEKVLNQSGAHGVVQVKKLDTLSERPYNGIRRGSSSCGANDSILCPIAVEAHACTSFMI
jgi:sec-independent protein translocase protein TatA